MAIFHPHRIDIPQPITNNFATGDYVGNHYIRLYRIRCISVHGGLLGTWVKYNQHYFYLGYAPDELTYRSHASTDFHAWWLKRRGLAQGCAFLDFFHIAPHLGGQKPQKYFGALIYVFKPNSWNRKNVRIIKTIASIPTKFCTVRPPNALRGWSRHTHYKSKMADGRHLGKIEKLL